LPSELTPEQRLKLVRFYAQDLAQRHRCAVDYALHEPSKEGDDRNYHAHILCTTRKVVGLGLGPKCDREKSGRDRKKDLEGERKGWAFCVNYELQRAGIDDRVDHRSLKDQGIEDRVPTSHVGPTVTAIQRRGGESEVVARIEVQAMERLRLAKEAGELERELVGMKKIIIDTKTQLGQALADRQRTLDMNHQQEVKAKEQKEKWRLLHLQRMAEAKADLEAARPQVSAPEAPTIVISLQETVADYLVKQQATAANMNRSEEWREVREGEKVVGLVEGFKEINAKRYLVISGGPNMARTAQQMILVHDPQGNLLSNKQRYKGVFLNGEMVRDRSMLQQHGGERSSR
jgi:hypothetical protein